MAANKGRPSRKCFQQAFEAFRIFRKSHENAYLYLHTTLSASYAAGEDLATLLASLEIPDDAVKYPNQYSMMFAPLDDAKMAQIFSSFDVLLNCSMGEGFGIPVLEAAACGTPSIVTDFSAMPEVAGPSPWKVSGRPHWTGQCSWMKVPDVGEMVGALEEAHEMSDDDRRSSWQHVRDHALDYAARGLRGVHAPGDRGDPGADRDAGTGQGRSMRVGWLHDDPGYVGGAELTMREFRDAAPKGVRVVDCPPGTSIRQTPT